MKEKTKKVKNKKKIIIGIIFALISLYLIYAVYLLIKQPTDKVTVENGTLYLEETDVGYIIRDEKVVKGNNYKNGMEQIKTEGEKTAQGESIKYRPKEKQRHNLPPKHRMNARQSGLQTENKSLSPAIVTAISIYS